MTALLSFTFFLSGAAALIFEVLWFRLAGLTFGNSVWAGSIVLASFMGGLALGNGLAARWGERLRDPLRAYALLEGGIAVTGLSLVLFLPRLTSVLSSPLAATVDTPVLLNGLRLAVSFALMLVPATAMGATLPVLVRALSRSDRNFGKVLGLLYGWNTLGAVAGVAVGEALLVRHLGVRGAGVVAAGLDVVAAGAVLLISGRLALRSAPAATVPEEAEARGGAGAASLVAVSILCGFTLLALEVIWFRFMLLFFPSSTWTFSIMLATVLLGISLGGLAAAGLFRLAARAERALAYLLLGNAVLVALIYAHFDRVVPLVQGRPVLLQIAIASLALIFPVCLVSGAAYPLLGKRFLGAMRSETRAAGILTLTNTAGGTAGSFLGGLVLLPRLGVEASVFALAALYLVAAALLFLGERRSWSGRAALAFAAAAAISVAALAQFPFQMMREKYLDLALPRQYATAFTRVGFREGVTETIQYLEKRLLGEPHYHQLMTNSYSMSGTNLRSKRYMKFFVYLGLALNPSARDALLICYGCGSTAKALTDSRSLGRIDFVDISRDVFEASSIVYPDPKDNPIHDPRVRTHVEDGRFFLLTARRGYDLITAEPPPPRLAGVVSLYTQEYFQLLHDRLNPGGVVTYWLPVYQMAPEEARSIVKAFSNVFGRQSSIWTGAGLEWMLVGIREPVSGVSAEGFARQWSDPVVGREMAALGFASPGQIGSLFIADQPAIEAWVAGAPPLVDNHPHRLSPHTGAPVDAAPYQRLMEPGRSRDEFMKSAFVRSVWPEPLREEAARHFPFRPVIDRIFGDSGPDLVELDQALRSAHPDPYVLWAFRSDRRAQEIIGEAIRQGRFEELSRGEPNVIELYLHLAARATRERDFPLAGEYLKRIGESLKPQSPLNDYCHAAGAYLLYVSGRKDRALELLQGYARQAPELKEHRERLVRSVWGFLLALEARGVPGA